MQQLLNRDLLIEKYGKDQLHEVKYIDLKENGIYRISSDAFEGLKNIETISLHDNVISEIDADSFATLYYLKYLRLNSNRLDRVHKYIFNGLIRLKGLYLDNNQIADIDVDSFNSLSHLKELKLHSNKLKELVASAFKPLMQLERLDLEFNEIVKIDSHFFEMSLPNLKYLQLHYNNLKRIDANTFKGLVNLEGLYLGNNQINGIEAKSFESLANLRELFIHHNKLSRIESSTLSGLGRLEKLHLEFNKIERIDANSFENLSSLKLLKLNNNMLKSVSRKCFASLSEKSIEVIELYDNEFAMCSFLLQSTKLYWQYDIDKLKDKGFTANWNEFLSQFLETVCSNEVAINIDDLTPRLDHSQENEIKKLRDEVEKLRVEIKEAEERERQLRKDLERERKIDRENIDSIAFSSKTRPIYSFERGYSLAESKIMFIDENFLDSHSGKIFGGFYKAEKRLGSGASGQVYLVTDLIQKKFKAMKLMNKNEISINELNILKKLVDPNIVEYYDHFEMAVRNNEPAYICIITEYCQNGDLSTRIKEAIRSKSRFSNEDIFNWVFQIAGGVMFIHNSNIIHRDIKPANILFTADNVVKIADLGMAKETRITDPSSFIGTLSYMSPQQFKCLNESGSYNNKTDVWSLGCVLYEMIFLKKAYPQGPKEDIPKLDFSGLSLFSGILQKMMEWEEDARIDSNSLYQNLLMLKTINETIPLFKDMA